MQASAPSFMPVGERLGVWRLTEPIGLVPSGFWWQAQHSGSGERACLLEYQRPSDAGAVLRHMAEALGQGWQHPALRWPLDSGLTPDGRPYVVLPGLSGQPLLTELDAAPLSARVGWAATLCELLAQAEQQGLEAAELDPSLLWLPPDGRPVLHGLALVPLHAQHGLGSLDAVLAGQRTDTGQALEADPFDTPRDAAALRVHRMGMLLCWLANGRVPSQRGAAARPTVKALAQWMSLHTAPREALDALLRQAVSADPAERPATLADLHARIQDWLALAAAPQAALPTSGRGAAAAVASDEAVAERPSEGSHEVLNEALNEVSSEILGDLRADAPTARHPEPPDAVALPTPAQRPVRRLGLVGWAFIAVALSGVGAVVGLAWLR